jgi:hypothetical protein
MCLWALVRSPEQWEYWWSKTNFQRISKTVKKTVKWNKIKYINDIIKDFKRVPFFYIKLHIPYKRWKNNQKKNINVQKGDLTI